MPSPAPTPTSPSQQNEKFLECSFGQCANFLCQGQALLPVGVQDQPRKSNVHLYCPKCNGVFHPPSSRHSSALRGRARARAAAPSLPARLPGALHSHRHPPRAPLPTSTLPRH